VNRDQVPLAIATRTAGNLHLGVADLLAVDEDLEGRDTFSLQACLRKTEVDRTGSVGTTWIGGGKPRVAFLFSIENGRIQGIDVVMDPEDLKEMEVEPLGY
jgi:hypothetical protein